MKEGLELELEHKDLSFDGKTWFLKIHLPWKTKIRYATLMGLKLPVKRFITISVKAWVRVMIYCFKSSFFLTLGKITGRQKRPKQRTDVVAKVPENLSGIFGVRPRINTERTVVLRRYRGSR